ncbi:MAG: hypothetical protein WC007_05985, partial [Pelobacteraceae bacterium]
LKDGSCVLLFFSDGMNQNDLLYSLGLLRAKRVRPVVIFFDRASFLGEYSTVKSTDDPLKQELFSQRAPVYTVARGDDLTGVFV